ncbi:response regulator transcription factor [Pleionea sp. CnH1-48]|uniref:response regulator transcription factor n=1 Tax=Pleionea sp. CnH1-48 TaxID=2954494 RepID=UPI0020976F31|nr:response regulator transcription factor [Pleionea sp. CnH1-48]MCO7224237.1 response regulator transcription factor [Pleionea sp. CnH1-48]
MSDVQPLIYIVEDDPDIARLTSMLLESEGFRCQTFESAHLVIDTIKSAPPQVVILDVMLPDQNGVDLCAELRRFYQGAVLMVTGCDDDITQLASFNKGADDYVIKPIKPHLLLARIRALLNRTANQSLTSDDRLHFADLTIDCQKRAVFVAEQELDISCSEYDILILLANHAGEIVSREHCCEELRGLAYDGLDRSIDMRVSSLRKKLSAFSNHQKRIITVRGRGYMWVNE